VRKTWWLSGDKSSQLTSVAVAVEIVYGTGVTLFFVSATQPVLALVLGLKDRGVSEGCTPDTSPGDAVDQRAW
jgi:hypothetical protein